MPFSRASFLSKDHIHISCIGRWILYHWETWEAWLIRYSPIQNKKFKKKKEETNKA